MFVINKNAFGPNERYVLLNQKTQEYVSVIPSFGGHVNELILKENGVLHSIIDGATTNEELIANPYYKSAKLIPFPNRIKDGKYTFKGKTYQLPINHLAENNAIHGLLYNKPFIVKKMENDDSSALLQLEYSYNRELEGYPFAFLLHLEFILNINGLKIKTTVVNKGNSEMPFADGWHPYFTLQESVNNLSLLIPGSKKIEVDNKMIPTGIKSDMDNFDKLTKISDSLFDTTYSIDTETIATTQLSSHSKNLSIHVWQETGLNKYNFVQVYIPPDRNSVAIEPMTSLADAFNNKEGLIILKPGDVYINNCGVYLSK
jgi:aldose 1-epimerase